MTSGSFRVLSGSTTDSRTVAVATQTSTAGTRPLPSARGTMRSEITAASALASVNRTSLCWCGA